MKPGPETRVTVQITTGKSMDARDPSTVTLRVEDDVSGETLVHVEIPAWEWWDLCTGSHRRFAGLVTPYPERIRKVMLNDSVTVPADVVDAAMRAIPHGRGHLEQRTAAGEAAAEAWAAGLPDADRWESLSGRQSNSGWMVVRRRWVDPDDPDAAARLADRARYGG